MKKVALFIIILGWLVLYPISAPKLAGWILIIGGILYLISIFVRTEEV